MQAGGTGGDAPCTPTVAEELRSPPNLKRMRLRDGTADVADKAAVEAEGLAVCVNEGHPMLGNGAFGVVVMLDDSRVAKVGYHGDIQKEFAKHELVRATARVHGVPLRELGVCLSCHGAPVVPEVCPAWLATPLINRGCDTCTPEEMFRERRVVYPAKEPVRGALRREELRAMVLPYCGTTWYQHLTAWGKDVGQFVAGLIAVARYLSRWAAVGLVHSDVKECNLTYSPTGGHRIVDMGMVTNLGSEAVWQWKRYFNVDLTYMYPMELQLACRGLFDGESHRLKHPDIAAFVSRVQANSKERPLFHPVDILGSYMDCSDTLRAHRGLKTALVASRLPDAADSLREWSSQHGDDRALTFDSFLASCLPTLDVFQFGCTILSMCSRMEYRVRTILPSKDKFQSRDVYVPLYTLADACMAGKWTERPTWGCVLEELARIQTIATMGPHSPPR